MCELAKLLSEFEGQGYVVAPAGFGKTYLIAQAVSFSTHRQLVLTHTYAGVNALRRKMRELNVNSNSVHIDTIASWALRISLAYRQTSGWEIERPENNEQWTALYNSCSDLLEQNFIRSILVASYGGMYVDEYQDCSRLQNELVLKIARDMPCRVLGDPLQGIFDFGGQESVDWVEDVESNFKELGQLDTPHRWIRAGRADLGEWLKAIRVQLERAEPVNLNIGHPDCIDIKIEVDADQLNRIQGNACRYIGCDVDESVIAIHKGEQRYKAKCHALSKNLSGSYSSIEEIEGKELFAFIRRLNNCETDQDKFLQVLELARKCMNAVNLNLAASVARGVFTNVRENTRNPTVAKAANAFLEQSNSENICNFLKELKRVGSVRVTRSDLLNRVLGALQKHALNPQVNLNDAVEAYQSEFRYKGRPVGHRKLIGTTLLVKGLEYDHAIVLEANSLSKKELYVALTRGAKSLTIVSTSPVLNPG